MRLDRVERALLVALHQPGVADHVGGQDGGQPALDPYRSHRCPLLG